MKLGLALLALVCTAFSFGQEGRIEINGKITGAENSTVQLVNKNMGGIKNPICQTTADAEGNYAMDTTLLVQDYYYLRLESGQLLTLVLKPNDKLTVNATSQDLFQSSEIIGSPHSVLMNEFLGKYGTFKKTEDSLKMVLRKDPKKQGEVNAFFSPRAQEFYDYRNKFLSANQGSPAVLAVLNAVDAKKEWDTYKTIVSMLQFSFPNSPTIKGLIKFVDQKDSEMVQMAEFNANKAKLFSKGVIAKDIALPDTSGYMRKLSDLRGKVVLIDFWASWCKPCRKENPNVVAAYNKYHSEGFEVYSVSLDKPDAKERWKAAIKQDGLIWPNHVSDLKGFQSIAATDYMVNSIPFTVLIDADGKVIATNLRGQFLLAELERIYGF